MPKGPISSVCPKDFLRRSIKPIAANPISSMIQIETVAFRLI
jgi:hypothetical protein